jgi:hypothetical protein
VQAEANRLFARLGTLQGEQSTLTEQLTLASREQENTSRFIHTFLTRVRGEVHYESRTDALSNSLTCSSVQIIGMEMKEKLQLIVDEKLHIREDNLEEGLRRE